MPESAAPTLPNEIVLPPTPEAVQPPAPAPEPIPEPAPDTTPVAQEIEKPDNELTIEEKIAVALGEKKVKAKQDAPAEEKKDDAPEDPELEKEIEATTKNLSRDQQEAFKKKTYELRDAKRKLKEAEAATAKLTEYEAKLADLEKKLAEQPTPTAEPSEDIKAKIAELEKQLAEKESLVAASKFELSEAYQRDFAKPIEATRKALFEQAKEYNLNERDLREALNAEGSERKKLLSALIGEFSEIDKLEFFQNVKTYDDLNVRSVQAIANAKTALEQQEANRVRETQEQQAQRLAQWSQVVDDTWSKFSSSLPFLAKNDASPEWNQKVDSVATFAKAAQFEQFDTNSQAEILHRAAVHPLMMGVIQSKENQITALNAKLTELTNDLARYREAEPGAGEGSKVVRSPDVDANGVPKNAGFTEAINQRLAAAGIK